MAALNELFRQQSSGGVFRIAPCAVVVAMATLGATQGAQAFEVDTGNPDFDIRLDTQVRYSAGWRMEKQNSAFANSPSYDSTEAFAKRGDMITNRINLLSELDVVHNQTYGFRVSGSAWRDFAYGSSPKGDSATSEYDGGQYNGYASRFHRGFSGEILDAFIFANFEDLAVPVRFKLGQHTVYWGEGIFASMHSISYSQGPLDGLKAATSPGIEAKEVFMPVNQFSGQAQLTPELSFAFQYMLDWKPTRIPAGGTYFAGADLVRADRVVAAVIPGVGPVTFPIGDDIEPDKKHGQFGVNLRWAPDWLQGTAGIYYRRFNETLPWTALRLTGGGPLPDDLHFAYPENTQLYGLSLTKAIGPVSVGSEISYRKNTALIGVPSGDFSAVGDLLGEEGPRGNTWHALVNGVYLLPKTALWEGGQLIGELVYSRLDKVTKNEALFYGEGSPGCIGLSKSDGCATKDMWLAQVNFSPEYTQAFPGVNLTLPFSVAYGIKGNGATLGGGNEGAVTWSAGVTANVREKYEFSLKYNDSYTKYKRDSNTGLVTTQNGSNAIQNNHGWLSFNFKTSF